MGFPVRYNTGIAVELEMATDLGVICDELQRLGKRKPNPKARAQLNDALNSKWDTVRIVAARALAQWGDEESMMPIRTLLEDLATKPNRTSATTQVASLLRNHLKQSEFDWLVDLFIHKAPPGNRYWIQDLFRDFPPSMVRKRMEIEREKARGNKKLTQAIDSVIYQSKA